MPKQLVFVDDSGDPGFKPHSSAHFVMACAIFMDDKIAAQVAQEIRNLRESKKWGEKAEFKFTQTRKSVVKELLQIVSKYDFKVSAVYIDKTDLSVIMPIVDQSKLYNWTIKELLSTIPLKDARIRIDGRSSKQYMKEASSYLRKELNKKTHKILNVKFEDSSRSDLIQLADVVAGAVSRSLQKDKTDSKEYLAIIKSKVESIAKISL
jgi:predicted kinase